MALTPEDISGKSFSLRLRGADPAEVREFLKSVAAQIVDLQDRISQQHEKIEEQEKELELAADDKKSFEDVIGIYKGNIEQLKNELSGLREQGLKRDAEYEQFKLKSDGVQQERERLAEKLSAAQKVISELESGMKLSRTTVDELRGAVVRLETDKRSLVDQKERQVQVLEDSSRRAEELVKNAEERGRQLIADARERIEEHRGRAVQEIAGLREDIERLRKQRTQVADDLKNVLSSHMERLDAQLAEGEDTDAVPGEYDGLFQKIDFTELVEFDLDDETDVLIDDPLGQRTQGRDSEDHLKSTLKDGGVSYLSDE